MTAIHPNSAAAFIATGAERESYEERILELMGDGIARTDREVAENLGIQNTQYRARINNLIETGKLHEVGGKKCQWTHKTVRLTRKFL